MGWSEEEARQLQDNVLGLNAKKQVGSDTPYQQMVEKNKAILDGAKELSNHLEKTVENSMNRLLFGGFELPELDLLAIQFVLVPVSPIGAVRTTVEGAKFDKRFKAYSQYKEKLRMHLGMQKGVWGIDIVAYIAAPKSYMLEDCKRKSYTKAERAAMFGQLAQVKPDWDNIAKGVQDACMDKDEAVGLGFTVKRYCADGEERMYVRFRKTTK